MPKLMPAAVIVVVVLASGCSSGDATRTERPSIVASNTADASPADSADEPTAAALMVSTDDGAELLFEPEQVSVAAGTAVQLTFTNRSTVPHNLTLEEPIAVGTAQVVAPGESETIAFTVADAGDYTFVCTLHPGMDGVLGVTAP